MVVFAELTAPTADFPLGRLLAKTPGGRARLDRVVPVGAGTVPYLWVEDVAPPEVEVALSSDSDVESFEVIDAVSDRTLVRVRWTERFEGFVDAVRASEGALLDGVGRGERWRFEVRFPDHGALSAFFDTCRNREIDLALSKVLTPGLPTGEYRDGALTERQREALLTALEAGYFEVPRRATLSDLSERLEISDSAVSQRIRRGIAGVLRTNVANGE